MQVNVNHSGSTLFDVSGNTQVVSKVLLAFLESQGCEDSAEMDLFQDIFNKCASAKIGIDGFLWVDNYLLNFGQ
jgi:ferritin